MAVKNGLIQEKGIDGQIIKETEWLEGKKHGWEKTFDSAGQPIKKIQYEFGNKILEEEYYKGLLAKSTSFINGKKDGLVIEYSDGKKILEVEYKNGKKDGRYLEYYKEEGSLKSEKKYENGRRCYPFEKNYYPSGNFHYVADENGSVYYDLDNNVPSRAHILIEGELIRIERYYSDGKIGVITDMKNQCKNTYFSPEGKEVSAKVFKKKFFSLLNRTEEDYFQIWEDYENDERDKKIPFEDDFTITEEQQKASDEFVQAEDDLIQVARSIDLLGLVNEDCVKSKLHEAIVRYDEANKKQRELFPDP